MAKVETVTPDETRAIPPGKSNTNWAAFNEARLVPSMVRCDGYQKFHPQNFGCHTRIIPSSEAMVNHINEHGGGFRMSLEVGTKPWAGWDGLDKLGVDCVDLRCEVCDAQVPFRAPAILKHLKAHQSKNRKLLQGGEFNFTLTFNRAAFGADDYDE